MTDARTEARRRIAETLLKASHADSCMEPLYVRESEVLADAVLDLFERSCWEPVYPQDGAASQPTTQRRLVLVGPVETIPDEGPDV